MYVLWFKLAALQAMAGPHLDNSSCTYTPAKAGISCRGALDSASHLKQVKRMATDGSHGRSHLLMAHVSGWW